MKQLTPKFPHILHGGDYNPEQWRTYPDVLQQDIVLMKKANINVVSLGIFAWAALEPEKDKFSFDWMDSIIDKLYENGIYVVLATPSGARPQWLAQEYPEVLRVNEQGQRMLYGHRHNHCYTSPAYRERVRIIDTKLAERYANHPAVILWHISNEFGGECHCPLCQQEFRKWLQTKYQTLDNLNHAWWSHFWSHTYTSWDQLHSPSSIGETAIHGLNLDWQRFVTDRTIDFMCTEIDAVKAVSPNIPVTTNMMGMYAYELNYYKFAEKLDVISWDCYPDWHSTDNSNTDTARNESLSHDMMRSLKKQPFLMMECTPSATNWRKYSKLKKPGMHELSVMNAIAHGADSGMYFQIRQSRGSCEKFHSAVISHTGTENTRTFREVSQTGADLKKLSDLIYGEMNTAKAAIIFDTENKWALDRCQGPRNAGLDYFGLIQKCYHYFWKHGVAVDIVDSSYDFSDYQLVIAPMLYMFRDGIQDKLRSFTANGGVLFTTCFSGVVNEMDLCLLGEATEEKLSDVLGMWTEETDCLCDDEYNGMVFQGKHHRLSELCEIVHPTTCEVLSTYTDDFYKGSPALTRNRFGKGTAYHLCATVDAVFLDDFAALLCEEAGLEKALDTDIPDGVSVTYRMCHGEKLVFVQNFSGNATAVPLSSAYEDVLSEVVYNDTVMVNGYSFAIVKKHV